MLPAFPILTAPRIRRLCAATAWRLLAPVSLCASFVLLAPVSSFAALTGDASYAPPAAGTFAYNAFVPTQAAGVSYVGPVFGETVQRLTTDHGHDDLYARNMWWSADHSRYLHRTSASWSVIDVATGAVTHSGIPFGSFAADGGFDPVDPDVLYYLVQDRGDGQGEIHQITLRSAGAWTDTVYFTAPAPLADLGGTLNWLDAGGRYMVVRYGAEPSVHLYDRHDLSAGPYANPIDGTNYIEMGGYVGLTPDGQFLVGYDDRAVGFGGMGQGVSWKLDHANRAIAAAPTIFWSLCGDHGSFVSASDGRNYMVVNDCYSQAGLWRVDITNDADGLDEAQQQALPNNALLLAYPTWSDFGHMSTAARGPLRDWAFLATEDGADTFNSGTVDSSGNIAPWHGYRQEIVAINVISGEVRRLAHHRSRSLDSDYYSTPRVSASWDGSIVGFASNFNQQGTNGAKVDVYAIPFDPSSPVYALLTTTLTGSGSVTSSPAGIDCGSRCTAGYPSGTVITLTASAAAGYTFAGWGGACSGTDSCTITLTADIAVSASFSAPATPSVSVTVTPASVTGGIAATGKVSLASPAPAGGAVVTISSNSASATVATSVTVSAGSTSKSFTIATSPVAGATSATIAATYHGTTATATLTVNPPGLSKLTLSPTRITGGESAKGTVTLDGKAPAGGAIISLASSTGAAIVGASVKIAAGAASATFTVRTVAVGAVTPADISASYNQAAVTARLSVLPPALSNVTLGATSVVGGDAVTTNTVTLTSAAPPSGMQVTLKSSKSAATVTPSIVSIPGGAKSATFTVATTPVTSSTTATISASLNGVTKGDSVTVKPPAPAGLTVTPSSVTGGNSATGTVTLTGAAPSGGTIVTLKSSNTGVATVAASVTVPEGATSAVFATTTFHVGSQTSVTISASTAGVTKSSKLTVVP